MQAVDRGEPPVISDELAVVLVARREITRLAGQHRGVPYCCGDIDAEVAIAA